MDKQCMEHSWCVYLRVCTCVCTTYNVRTLYSAMRTLHTVQCTEYTIHCIVHSVHCTVYIVRRARIVQNSKNENI